MRINLLTRGDLYRVPTSGGDPRRSRIVLVTSRQRYIESASTTVVCVPVYSAHEGLETQVAIGPEVGLQHDSSLHCDRVLSVPKTDLRHYIGSLSSQKLREVNRALAIALDIDPDDLQDL
jgi:mRNA interferase MazF